MSDDPVSLGEALPKEIARVRDEVMPAYQAIGPAGTFALLMMRDALDKASAVMAEGDVVEMMRAYDVLKGFHT